MNRWFDVFHLVKWKKAFIYFDLIWQFRHGWLKQEDGCQSLLFCKFESKQNEHCNLPFSIFHGSIRIGFLSALANKCLIYAYGRCSRQEGRQRWKKEKEKKKITAQPTNLYLFVCFISMYISAVFMSCVTYLN